MFTVFVTLEVKPDLEDEFLADWLKVVDRCVQTKTNTYAIPVFPTEIPEQP